jgi:SAM-dependent methyltransferase
VASEIERILVRFENFKHLLLQIHQVELASIPASIRAASAHRIVANTKWQLRWKNLKRQFIYGSAAERFRYISTLSERLSSRVGLAQRTVSEQEDPVLSKLGAIRDALNGRKLIIFPATIDFYYMAQRPQHLARAFAEAGYVVIYGTLNHHMDKVEISEQVADNLYLLNENYFPFLSRIFQADESIYYCLWPNNVKHLEYLPYSYLLYDYMDELSLLNLPSNELERDHLSMLGQADLVTVSAYRLMLQLPEHILPKALLVNNAVSREFIDAVAECGLASCNMEPLGVRSILGYYGAIAEWLDFDLIERMAEELPDSTIVLIGPISENVSRRVANILWNHSNIRVLPACKQFELIPFLMRFDVCLIPFIKNAVTDAVSPVKLFEYFGAGKPVVTTNLAECVKYAPVHIADDHRQFVDLVRKALCQSSARPDVTAQQFALNNTWGHRVQQIRSMMQSKDSQQENTLLDAVQAELAAGLQIEREDLYEFYLGQYAVQERHYWLPVTKWIDSLVDVRTLIDIGPAYGTLMVYSILKCHPEQKLAWDKIRFMPSAAVAKYGIKYQSLDIERDQIPDQLNADLIIFTEVIEHLNFHPLTTLQKLRKMLSARGTLILTTPDAAEWGKVTKYYRSLKEMPAYDGNISDWIDGHIWQYEKGELDNLLCEAGFTINSFDYAPGVCGRHLCYQLTKSTF